MVKYVVMLCFVACTPSFMSAKTPSEPPQINSVTELSEARLAFETGAYEHALILAGTYDTAEALVLQAEIMSSQIMLGLADRPHRYARQARTLAAEATSLDPDNVEAHIQHALAFGFEARTAGVITAWRKKLPEQCKQAIDKVHLLAPQDARTTALIGAWHLGIVRKAGERRASSMYGASETAGIQAYEAALEMDPGDIIIGGNYVFALMSFDRGRHHERAVAVMNALSATQPVTATEQEVKRRIMILNDVMDDPQALDKQLSILMNE